MNFTLLAFSSLLAIVNPLASVPLYLALTASYTARQRHRTLWRAVVTGTIILIAFATFGTGILNFFGVTTQAFKIAGGILFFFIGWDMLEAKRSPRGKVTPEEEVESAAKEDIGIIPLGMPGLVGPGAITTVIALAGQRPGFANIGALLAAVVAVMVVSGVVLLGAPLLLRTFGRTGLNVMTRLMGLLVMVIGVQFVIDGIGVVVAGMRT